MTLPLHMIVSDGDDDDDDGEPTLCKNPTSKQPEGLISVCKHCGDEYSESGEDIPFTKKEKQMLLRGFSVLLFAIWGGLTILYWVFQDNPRRSVDYTLVEILILQHNWVCEMIFNLWSFIKGLRVW